MDNQSSPLGYGDRSLRASVTPTSARVGYDGGELVRDSGGNKVYTHFLGYGLLVGSLEPE